MKPILFSGPLVRAILEGRKTQTRRILSPQPISYQLWGHGVPRSFPNAFCVHARWPEPYDGHLKMFKDGGDPWLPCPFGKVGDGLWVRETWSLEDPEYLAYGEQPRVLYAATDDYEGPSRPSIHMPREYARLFLEITRIQAHQLQKITEDDAKAEGTRRGWYLRDTPDGEESVPTTYRDGFKVLWDSIYGGLNLQETHGWDANPWVWAISFKVVSQKGATAP